MDRFPLMSTLPFLQPEDWNLIKKHEKIIKHLDVLAWSSLNKRSFKSRFHRTHNFPFPPSFYLWWGAMEKLLVLLSCELSQNPITGGKVNVGAMINSDRASSFQRCSLSNGWLALQWSLSFWLPEQEVTRVGHLAEAANPIEKLCWIVSVKTAKEIVTAIRGTLESGEIC